jgi:hypothetical protein
MLNIKESGFTSPPPPPPTNPPPTFNQEIHELSRIFKKDLTVDQVEELKKSRLTKALNSDDDLKITY